MAPAGFKDLLARFSGFIRARTDRMIVTAPIAATTAAAAVTVQQN